MLFQTRAVYSIQAASSSGLFPTQGDGLVSNLAALYTATGPHHLISLAKTKNLKVKLKLEHFSLS